MLKATYAPSTIARIQARKAALGLIHEAKNQLQLSDSAYRDLISTASKGVTRTSAELDKRGRDRALKALKDLGYVESKTLSPIGQARQERRLKELGVIHMAKRGLSLSEKAYRSLVVEASRGKSRSCAHLNARERGAVIKALAAKGYAFEAA